MEFNVKTGPVTIFSCTQTCDGRLKFLAAEGESIPSAQSCVSATPTAALLCLPSRIHRRPVRPRPHPSLR
ncbi:MAG: hypothetical protein R2856_32215 [Caldilineaceae bacterium]